MSIIATARRIITARILAPECPACECLHPAAEPCPVVFAPAAADVDPEPEPACYFLVNGRCRDHGGRAVITLDVSTMTTECADACTVAALRSMPGPVLALAEREARDWIAACWWDDLPREEAETMDAARVWRGIEDHYGPMTGSGVRGFLADMAAADLLDVTA